MRVCALKLGEQQLKVVIRAHRFAKQESLHVGTVESLQEVELILVLNTLCNNVSDCIFTSSGRSIQMILTLDDQTHTLTTTSSAFMHNP